MTVIEVVDGSSFLRRQCRRSLVPTRGTFVPRTGTERRRNRSNNAERRTPPPERTTPTKRAPHCNRPVDRLPQRTPEKTVGDPRDLLEPAGSQETEAEKSATFDRAKLPDGQRI